ncbi:unnamed protein product [Brachionus calyciflorus]|uniref:Uncharacterized protein n=1 Tax=Brachionus calyciflorus TaxID=104777 RepID=A0A813UUT5_9BILA|nr:unnamed protein product [Brachionus calyciflorus]
MRALNLCCFNSNVLNLFKLKKNPYDARKTLINLNQISNFKTKKYEYPNNYSKHKFLKYAGIFALGSGLFLISNYYYYDNRHKIKVYTKNDIQDRSLSLDLNEIYEKTAVVFLSNSEVREVIGMPIKIISSNELDQVRAINLRREGKEVFAFIAYDLQGSINSGTIFCKLRMDLDSEKFKTESIVCKLNKPDSQNRLHFAIKLNNK